MKSWMHLLDDAPSLADAQRARGMVSPAPCLIHLGVARRQEKSMPSSP
jgi:hypothetical protein